MTNSPDLNLSAVIAVKALKVYVFTTLEQDAVEKQVDRKVSPPE